MQVDSSCCFQSPGAFICPVWCPRGPAVRGVPGARCQSPPSLAAAFITEPFPAEGRRDPWGCEPAAASPRLVTVPRVSSERWAQNPQNLALPFVMLLSVREKEKPSDRFCFTSDWHLTGCLPRRQAAPAFSGNAVNVYTGTARAQALGLDGSCGPGLGGERASVGSERPLEGKRGGAGLCGPAAAVGIRFKLLHFDGALRLAGPP